MDRAIELCADDNVWESPSCDLIFSGKEAVTRVTNEWEKSNEKEN
jgi:hypothetical protein